VLAIASSILFVLYFLLPQLLFTFILGKFVPLRSLVRTKMEEVNDVLFFLFFIFFLVLFLVWFVPPFTHFPFGFDDSPSLRRLDYKILVDDLTGDATVRADRDCVWRAFGRCARRQGRVLSWYYFFIIAVAWGSGSTAKNYGKYQQNHPRYRWLADTFLIPNLSEWYPLLTNFTIKDKRTKVKVDILCDDTLYQGFVQEYFLGKEGGLSGIILTSPRRFDRQAYLAAKNAGENVKRDESRWLKSW